MSDVSVKNHADFIWSVADLLRGVYKQSEYGRVILPLTVLRRLDCVLEPTKQDVLDRLEDLPTSLENRDPVLEQAAGQSFFNTSKHTFTTLLADPDNVAGSLRNYVAGFSESARDIITKFNFDTQIDRLQQHNLLYLVVSKFADVDLHPEAVSNLEMGYLYEELIRKFSELSNETAGEHFTPREVIRLMVNLLFIDDDELLTKPGVVKTILDPACGTGGMLSVAEEHLRQLNPQARLEVFGQELNAETYATCRADMLIKGQDAGNIRFGNSFDNDQHQGSRFDYLLANPPFGVEWKMAADFVKTEHETLGFGGRFGAGLPRINDGSLLFLQHMVSKMRQPEEGGSRFVIVFNASPLTTGDAGSGESEIRRWLIERDLLEGIVALPDQLFYNTEISTYLWVISNRKSDARRGIVRLVDARGQWTKLPRAIGEKAKAISNEQISAITKLYCSEEPRAAVQDFQQHELGYLRLTIERPLRASWRLTRETLSGVEASKAFASIGDQETKAGLIAQLSERLGYEAEDEDEFKTRLRDEIPGLSSQMLTSIAKCCRIRTADGSVVRNRSGDPVADVDLRDEEYVPTPATQLTYEKDVEARLGSEPYQRAVARYMEEEVLPHFRDAWVDERKTRQGYEVGLTQHFFDYVPGRSLAEIDAELATQIAVFSSKLGLDDV